MICPWPHLWEVAELGLNPDRRATGQAMPITILGYFLQGKALSPCPASPTPPPPCPLTHPPAVLPTQAACLPCKPRMFLYHSTSLLSPTRPSASAGPPSGSSPRFPDQVWVPRAAPLSPQVSPIGNLPTCSSLFV